MLKDESRAWATKNIRNGEVMDFHENSVGLHGCGVAPSIPAVFLTSGPASPELDHSAVRSTWAFSTFCPLEVNPYKDHSP